MRNGLILYDEDRAPIKGTTHGETYLRPTCNQRDDRLGVQACVAW